MLQKSQFSLSQTFPTEIVSSQVMEAYRRLHQQIQQMTTKIQITIDKSQGEFLMAYQNHIRKIKIQLADIKSKSDVQEQQMKNNNKITVMEKQISLFREQALKLYDRLAERTQQVQMLKGKNKQLQKSCYVMQKQLKQQIKNNKILQAKLSKARAFQQQFKKPEINGNTNMVSILNSNIDQNIIIEQPRAKSNSVNSYIWAKQPHKNISTSKTVAMGLKRKSVNCSTSISYYKNDTQLKDYFLECIKSVKRDVAQRKNTGEQLNLDYIRSIQEFKMVDKLKLLQKFLENQKLLTWMYQKIFPSRIQQVRQYLSNKNGNYSSNRKTAEVTKKNSVLSEQILPQLYDDDISVDIQLPVHSNAKQKQKRKISEARNKVQIRDGRLGIRMENL